MSGTRDLEGRLATVFFLTLGCPKNEVDTDRMHALVANSGHAVTLDPEKADTVVLNTCGFIEDAVSESIENVLDLTEWRDSRPGRRLVVTGCMVSRYGADLHHELGEVDAFLSVADEGTLVAVLDELHDTTSSAPDARDVAATRTTGAHSTYLQVADGCFRDCSFCTIPAIRGPFRSRTLEDLSREAHLLVDGGAREIVLIGQDISAWGRELPGTDTIASVARSIASLESLEWLRLMYVQPDGIDETLLQVMASAEKIVEYLDMPLQHASPEVLRSMRRRGSAEEFLDLIGVIRAHMPDVALRTTLIAGFPGETEEAFAELASFVEAARFDYVGVFPFSPEEGTTASQLPGMLDAEERLARAQSLRDIADQVSMTSLESRVGAVSQVMFDGLDDEGAPVGRLRGQAPEVDGVVYLDHPRAPGTVCEARITNLLGYDLEGEVVACSAT